MSNIQCATDGVAATWNGEANVVGPAAAADDAHGLLRLGRADFTRGRSVRPPRTLALVVAMVAVLSLTACTSPRAGEPVAGEVTSSAAASPDDMTEGDDAGSGQSAGSPDSSSQPSSSPSKTPTESPSTQGPDGPQAAPATSTHVEPTEAASTTSPEDAGGSLAVVQISRASWDESRQAIVGAAVVPGVVESGGVCTVSGSTSGTTVEVTVEAEADASSTVCGEWVLPVSPSVRSTWQVTVAYVSDLHRGESQTIEVEIG